MIQAEKIIEIGKYKIDVSNISVKRKRIAVKDWNKLHNIKTDKDGGASLDKNGNAQIIDKPIIYTDKQAQRGLLKIGLYLVRQELKILNRRFKLTEAIKEYFKRYFISIRYIESLSEEESNIFGDFLYEVMTGSKKKIENLMQPMMDAIEEETKGMTELQMLDFATFLGNSFSEQASQYKSLKVGQKKA